MRARIRPNLQRRYPTFRRVGIVFGPTWQDVDTTTLRPEQVQFLTSEESRRYLEIEGAPETVVPEGTPAEAVAAAQADGEQLPGKPTLPEAERITRREGMERVGTEPLQDEAAEPTPEPGGSARERKRRDR
jgi:hypothetical protein